MVDEGIRVARGGAPLPPPLEGCPEDKDVDREEEEEVGTVEDHVGYGGNGALIASKEGRIEGGV